MTQIQFRRDTAASWTSYNPTLASGEVGYETDSGKHKLGTGSTAWTALAYVQTTGATGATGPTGPTGPTGAAPLQTINPQTVSYTLVAGDAGNVVTVTSSSATNLTVPKSDTVNYSVGTRIDVLQLGAGQVTVVATSGVTISATPGLKVAAQYGAASLLKLATDSWLLVGALAA